MSRQTSVPIINFLQLSDQSILHSKCLFYSVLNLPNKTISNAFKIIIINRVLNYNYLKSQKVVIKVNKKNLNSGF